MQLLMLFLALGLLAMSALFAVGDRDNFSGDISVTAPTGGYTRGKLYLVSGMHMVARETKSAAEVCLMAVRGAVWVTKVAGNALVVGQKIYFVSASNSVTGSATGNTLLGGFVVQAALSAATEVLINLDGPSPALT